MKFLAWCGCVTICLSGLQLSLFAHDRWRWLWIPLLAFYALAGLVLAVAWVVKLAGGKLAAGVGPRVMRPPGQSATPHAKE